MSRRGGAPPRSGAAALGPVIRMNPPTFRPAPPPTLPSIRVANPTPRTSPAGLAVQGNLSSNGEYSLSARQTFGGVNQNVYVQGTVQGNLAGTPDVAIEAGMLHFSRIFFLALATRLISFQDFRSASNEVV
jgi:hypothetical protein